MSNGIIGQRVLTKKIKDTTLPNNGIPPWESQMFGRPWNISATPSGL